jgi:type IV fimbrial biogenesis protein FimT
MDKQSGFTLMEVMIVIAIIGILSAIAIPNYIAYLPKQRLSQGTRDVYAAMQYARLRAVKDQTFAAINFNTGADSFTVFIDDGTGGGVAGDGIQNGAEPIVKNGTMPADVDITSAAFSGAFPRVRFDSRGLPNGFGDVDLQSTSQNQFMRKVTLRISGSPRITGSTDGGATWN